MYIDVLIIPRQCVQFDKMSIVQQLSNLSHIIRLIWKLKVAGALTQDSSWSSIFLEGKVLTYSCQLPY